MRQSARARRHSEGLFYLVYTAALLICLAAAAAAIDRPVNPDGIAYARIAGYWLSGRADLAINGYWGPLLSVLIALPLALGQSPFTAGYTALMATALFFGVTATAFLRLALPSPVERRIAPIIVSLITIQYSLSAVTPDLLMAGWFMLAAACMAAPTQSTPPWHASPGRQVGAGGAFGIAYLSKAIALPAGIGILLAFAIWSWLFRPVPRPATTEVLKATGLTLFVMLIVAAPWIVTISIKEHRPVFSTSGSINHALAEPSGTQEHPFMDGYYAVPPERITTWESPAAADYTDWSPLASIDNLRLQLTVATHNIRLIVASLRGYDAALLSLIATALAALALLLRRAWVGPPEAFALIAIAVVCTLYLPVYAGALRYYLVCIPFLLFLGLRATALVATAMPARFPNATVRRTAHAIAVAALSASFALKILPGIAGNLTASSFLDTRRESRSIVEAIASAGDTDGGIAAAGRDGRSAIDAAFRLNRPFNGFQKTIEDPAALRASGAAFLVLVDPPAGLSAAAASWGTPLATPTAHLAVYRLNR